MTKEEAIDILQEDIAINKHLIDTLPSTAAETFKNDILAYNMAIKALEQQPIEKCKWIKYDYRTMCPKEHDVDNPYWRIPENRMETLKYCPYCGKEIEVSE